MSKLANLFKGKSKNGHSPYHDMAKDYQRKAENAFKIFKINFPNYVDYTCFAITIKKLNFKDGKVEINFKPEEEIYMSNCKSEDELYESNEFEHPSNLKNDCWFEGRELGEVQPFADELRQLGFYPMWKYDAECNNYFLYPVFFATY